MAHLVRRFFDVASAQPLTPVEVDAVSGWLSPQLADMFFDQPSADQRHGYEAALTVIHLGFKDPDVIAAALMHDVAKRHAGLGVVGRSFASLAILARLPLSQRMTAYRDHGLVGAKELADAGAPSLAIDFALHHHRERPSTIAADTWAVLIAADQPPKTQPRSRSSITSGEA